MKTRILLTTLGAVGLAGSLQAQVIGDFEGAIESGWNVTAGSGAVSSDWASTGTSSFKLTPAASGFAWAVQFNDLTTAQKLASTHLLRLDVHWESAQWQPDTGNEGWVRWDQGSLNSDTGGWGQTSNANITDSGNPSYPGSWDPNNWGASHTRTLTYNFTGLGNTPGGAWGQFNLSYNFGNIETIGSFYVDNVQIVAVPEPTTLALAGLGGAALLLARRRK
jgi:hypothetical protein